MAETKPTNPINLTEKLKDLSMAKHHPNSIVGISMNVASDMMDGRVEFLEPSGPLPAVIEIMGMLTTFAVEEYHLLSRKTFSKLANNEEDLYLHMSDREYLNRFSSPAKAKVRFNINLDEFRTYGYKDPVTKDTIFEISRNSILKIENCIFTLPSPIIIRQTQNGVIDVRYNNALTDDIFPLKTDYLDYRIKTLHNPEIQSDKVERYISFVAELPEVMVEAVDKNLTRFKPLNERIDFDVNRMFYYLKAFYLDANNQWKEMSVTHTEEIIDIKTPTCIVKVLQDDHTLRVIIPPFYQENGLIFEKVKFLVYTTNGPININFNDFKPKDFVFHYNKVFTELETGPRTEMSNSITKIIYIDEQVIGGTDRKSTEDLKFDVIHNNLDPSLPITSNQIENILRNTQLTPVRNHDVVTEREFLVKTRIPSSVSRYRIARMSLDLIEFKSSFSDLLNNKNGVIRIRRDLIVIPQDTLFEVHPVEGVRVLREDEAKKLKAMSGQDVVNYVNNKNYMTLYYHYVLDGQNDTTNLRAYELSRPTIENINFKDYNETTLFGINTVISNIERTATGFTINILAGTKLYNEMYSIHNITPYLVYATRGGYNFFLEGKVHMDIGDTPVIKFYIDTVGHIDHQDKLYISNFTNPSGDKVTIAVNLVEDFQLLYITNSFPDTFQPREMDKLINANFLSGSYAVVTQETHTIKFGERLERLYSRIHTSVGDNEFELYEKDVQLTYDKTIYNEKNQVIHRPNEVVLDAKGNPIIVHKKGDIKLDAKGEPVGISRLDRAIYPNVLLMDYKIFLGNSVLVNEYKEHVRLSLNTIVLNNMVSIQEDLLERTKAFLTVPNGLADIDVEYNGKRGFIKSGQAFKFDLYVYRRVYEDLDTRKGIELTIKETLDTYLTSNKYLSKSEIISTLRSRTKEFVRSISLNKFTELDAEYIEILNDNAEVSIKKRLISIPGGYDVLDDITFNFVVVQ